MFLAHKSMSFPRSGGGDPYFENVSLLLHMDGVQGGTSFVDSSKHGHVITANSVTTDQSIKQFGTASAYFGTGQLNNCLTIPGHESHYFGTGDFTIEAWIYPTRRTSDGVTIYASSSALYSAGLSFYVDPSGRLGLWSFPANATVVLSSAIVPLSQFSFVAAERTSGQLRLFVGAAATSPVANTTNFGIGEKVSVGGYGYSIQNASWPGYIDEFRVTKGVARYSGSFSVPTEPFPNQ